MPQHNKTTRSLWHCFQGSIRQGGPPSPALFGTGTGAHRGMSSRALDHSARTRCHGIPQGEGHPDAPGGPAPEVCSNCLERAPGSFFLGGILALRATFRLCSPPKSPQAHPLETPLELGDPNCPNSRKLQTTFPSNNTGSGWSQWFEFAGGDCRHGSPATIFSPGSATEEMSCPLGMQAHTRRTHTFPAHAKHSATIEETVGFSSFPPSPRASGYGRGHGYTASRVLLLCGGPCHSNV